MGRCSSWAQSSWPASRESSSAGISSSRSAPCREPMRAEAWEPLTRARNSPWGPITSAARASSGRPPPRRRGASSRTRSRGRSCTWPPSSCCRAGQSSCRAVMAAATGLPGSPKKGLSASCPQAKGRPGLRCSFQKLTDPSSATRGRIQSLSPTETPPVLITTSQPWASSRNAWRNRSGWSATTSCRATG